MIVPLLIVGGIVTAVFLAKKKQEQAVAEKPVVTEKPSQTTLMPPEAPRITSIEQALKSPNVTPEAKEMLKARTKGKKSKEYYQKRLDEEYITTIKTDMMGGKGKPFRFLVFGSKPTEKAAFLVPRITSIEQALKSKWVTPQAKMLINYSLGKLFPKMKAGHTWTKMPKTQMESILKSKNIKAIRTQMMCTRSIPSKCITNLILESKPHQWKKMSSVKKASTMEKVKMIMGGPGVMSKPFSWSKFIPPAMRGMVKR